MKQTWVILCAVILLSAPFCSCKKIKSNTTYIFWFDKATSDSLKSAGVGFLYSKPDNYEMEENESWVYRTSVNNWSDAKPAYADVGTLFINISLQSGQKKQVGYQMSVNDTNDVPMVNQSYFLQHMPALKGTVEVQHMDKGATQLVWQ